MSLTASRLTDRVRVNEQIRAPKIRVIGIDGEQLGVMSVPEALRAAEEAALDLVEISPNSDPPVCRIMDYGKYLFELSKKQAAAKKKQKIIHVKEIKFRPTTEEGDYQVKLRNLIRFLNSGDKAKVTVRFRGREIAHHELGLRLMQRLQTDLLEYGVVEQEVKREGRQMIMVFAPKKKA
ncbi:MAG: translation initiation factor IF-3 [Proteobacteria bacterium]|nr:translation initiation factor IF-3 [Pseudomonadota bacterium]